MPAPLPELVRHAQELLSPLGPVRVTRMFGGHGLYVGELFIALVLKHTLHLKVDADSRAAFESVGCKPFEFEARGKTVQLNYFSAPDEALESPEAMRPWAQLAVEAALRARRRPAVRTRRPAR